MRAWAWVVAALLLAGCGSSGGAGGGSGGFGGTGGSSGSGGGQASLAPGPCGTLAFGHVVGQTVHCATLEVPADWDAPDSGERFFLPVSRYVPAGGGTGLPVVLLLGGPGDESDAFASYLTADSINQLGHEVVVFDQRGTGRAQPSPRCTELASVDPADPASGLDELAACRDRVTSEGVDLSLFNTFHSARDVDALAGALGYGQVALVGLSYGTRLALATLRDFPARVGAVVLDSVTPPNLFGLEELAPGVDDAIDRLIAACAGDPGCNAEYPGLGAKLDAAFAALPLPWSAGPGGQLTPETLAAALITIQGRDVNAIDDVPAVIDLAAQDASAGSVSASLSSALSQALAGSGGYDVAMFYAVTCSDNQHATAERAAERRAGVRPGLVPYFELTSGLGFSMCKAWPVYAAGPERFAPVVSDAPALVLNARFDTITPPSWAEDAASHLSTSSLVQITRAAHLVLFTEESLCSFGIVKQFLDAPGPVSTACAE